MSSAQTTFDNAQGPVVISFLMQGCGHCEALKPNLVKIAQNNGDKATFIFVDADKNPEMLKKWNVQNWYNMWLERQT